MKDKAYYEEQNIKNDYWLDPEEALSKGLIDEIIA